MIWRIKSFGSLIGYFVRLWDGAIVREKRGRTAGQTLGSVRGYVLKNSSLRLAAILAQALDFQHLVNRRKAEVGDLLLN